MEQLALKGLSRFENPERSECVSLYFSSYIFQYIYLRMIYELDYELRVSTFY